MTTRATFSSLTVYDTATGTLESRIAARVPTIENGDWKLLPDGRMEVTWKLRPNILWHAGPALTAEDFVFGLGSCSSVVRARALEADSKGRDAGPPGLTGPAPSVANGFQTSTAAS